MITRAIPVANTAPLGLHDSSRKSKSESFLQLNAASSTAVSYICPLCIVAEAAQSYRAQQSAKSSGASRPVAANPVASKRLVCLHIVPYPLD